MIEIKKGREPKELVEYRQLPDASYENMDSHLKNIVLDHLLH